MADDPGTSHEIGESKAAKSSDCHVDLSPGIRRRVGLARVALWWEHAWPALWPPTGLLGLYAFFALTGALEALPLILHWLVFLSTIAGTGFLVWRDKDALSWPTWANALRRLEGMNALPHRPLSTYADRAAKGTGSDQLWAAHTQWLKAQIAALKVRLPSPGLAAKDPFALRSALLLLLVVAFVAAGPNAASRLASAAFPGFAGQGSPGRLDAWIAPPDYTGRAPLFLTTDQREVEDVPQGSTVNVQIFGGSSPNILLGADILSAKTHQQGPNNTYESAAPIEADSLLSVTQGANELGTWSIATIPDLAPEVVLLEQIEATRRRTLRFLYQLTDDYGVVSLNLEMALDPYFVQVDKSIFHLDNDPAPKSDFAPLNDQLDDDLIAERIAGTFEMPLPGLRPKGATHTAFKDLTAHPWAGLPVSLTLIATDDAGQEGHSRTVTLALPAREFKEPLAAALIEQRQRLALSPSNRDSVAGFLNALTIEADRFLDDKSVFLGLRAAYWRLRGASHSSDLEGVSELLWDLALHIEDGDLSLAERDLRAAREALAEALAEGASPEEIEQLMEELKQALAEYLDQLSTPPSQADRSTPRPDADQLMERSDLEDMLDAIGDLARTGARDQAQELLSQLDEILENLETPEQQNGLTEGETALSDAIGKMGEMIERQRSLMDETFQHGQGAQSGAQGDEETQAGENGQTAPSLESLRNQQEALRQQLEELMGELGENGQPVPGGLDRAAKAMEDAADRLAKGRADSAAGSQGQAIDQLREGTQALADAMFDAMSSSGQQSGEQASGNQTDPLGRPTASGQNSSQATKLPQELDLQRARQILDELRKRAAELGRPQEELDYLERLLRRF